MMPEPEETKSAPPEGGNERKSLVQRFNSPEWSVRAGVLAGILSVAAAVIVVLKS